MSYDDDGKVRRVVRDCTDPKSRPTPQDIRALSSLTHDSDAVKVIQRMLLRRLDPKAYVIPEVENTMLMLGDCLATASHDFVAYVHRDLVPLISQFHSKKAVGDLRRVQQAAGKLLDILRDDGLTGKEGSGIHVRTDDGRNRDNRNSETTRKPNSSEVPITPPITPGQSRPESEYHEKKEINSAAIGHTGLPTPTTSPAERIVRSPANSRPPSNIAALDPHSIRIAEDVRVITSNTPQAASVAQLNTVANMTHDPKELEVVLSVIDARLEALKSQQTYFHLVKTLTLVHHCLIYASIEFVESCKSRRSNIENLRHINGLNDAVRSRAKAVLDLLEDKNCLHNERANRQVLPTPQSVSLDSKRLSSHVEFPGHPSPTLPEKRRSLLERADTAFIVEKLGKYAACSGGYSDVWKGRLTLDHGATFTLVAIKVLRLTSRSKDPGRLRKRLEREVRVWRKLEHENIAEFYGAIYDTNDSPAIISPWYDKGSADAYLRSHPSEDPMRMLWEIVLGIEYLHESNVVHGDIKGGNVMVDGTGRAKLIDFGLSRLLDSVIGPGLTTSSVSFSIRWCAPELVQSDESSSTKASDVYAFASTALELITGDVPYKSLKDYAVILAVATGVPPQRPENSQRCPNQVWSVLDMCWRQPSHRPTITEVKAQVRAFYRYSR